MNEMKCSICGNKVEELFLNKLRGTWVKDSMGKMHLVCAECQKKFPSKTELLKHI